MFLVTGSIYSISYSEWKTNPYKIYVFILYAGPNKIHALNINARQLGSIQKVKIINVISKIGKIPQASQYTGRVLYRILRKYLPNEIRLCYRTYKRQYITKTTLINYGLKTKEDFDAIERVKNMERKDNPQLYNEAKKDLIIKNFTNFDLADDDFNPICYKGKYWEFIKEDFEEKIKNIFSL